MRILAAAFLLVAAALVQSAFAAEHSGPVPLPPLSGTALVGLDDQNPSSFSEKVDLHVAPPLKPRTQQDVARWDRLKQDLHIGAARRLVKWNLFKQSCFAKLDCPDDQWVKAVEADGLSPDITLQGAGSGSSPPTAAEYRSAFTDLVDHFEAVATRNGGAPVVDWGAWNEPNEPANLVGSVPAGADLAADYWREANDVLTVYCTKHSLHGCTVVAGEFADVAGGFYSPGGYVYAYAQELLRKTSALPAVAYPTVWGEHPFIDLQNGWRDTGLPYRYPQQLEQECTKYLEPGKAWAERHGFVFQQADCFVNFFAGTASNGWDHGIVWHRPRVWLDAGGAVLDNGKDLTPLDAAYTKSINDPDPKVVDPNYPKPVGSSLARTRQTDAGREFLALRTRYHGAVQRLYYFDWGPGPIGGFYSSLIDANDASEPAYCALTSLPVSDCPGTTTSGEQGTTKGTAGKRPAQKHKKRAGTHRKKR